MINDSFLLDTSPERRELTIDQAYELSGLRGTYQYLIALSTACAVFANLTYIFFMPLFLINPVVLDENSVAFPSVEAACAASYRRYQDVDFNYVSQFDLLCQPLKASFIPSSFQVGILIASLTLSYLADYIGRLPVLIVNQAGIAISLSCIIFFSSYATCIVFTGVCGFFSLGALFYTFAYDSSHSRCIQAYTFYIGIVFAVGEIIVVLIMWLGFKWRSALLFTIISCMVYFIFPLFIRESPRFLYSKGKINAAIKTFKIIAQYNGNPIKQDFTLRDESQSAAVTTTFCEQAKLILEKWVVFRLLMCSSIFFTCGFIYYGFTLNVGKFVGNAYGNAFFNAVAEIAGVTLSFLAASHMGCRRPLLGALLFTSAALLVQYFSQSQRFLNNGAMYAGKMGVSAGLTFCYMLGGELFPTSVRTACIALLCFCERVGVMISPIVGNWPKVLIAMSIVCALVSSLAVLALHCGMKNLQPKAMKTISE